MRDGTTGMGVRAGVGVGGDECSTRWGWGEGGGRGIKGEEVGIRKLADTKG